MLDGCLINLIQECLKVMDRREYDPPKPLLQGIGSTYKKIFHVIFNYCN